MPILRASRDAPKFSAYSDSSVHTGLPIWLIFESFDEGGWICVWVENERKILFL